MIINNFAVIGHPIRHSMSPYIHKQLFSISQKKYSYDILDVPPEEIKDKMSILRSLSGFNITIPLKQTIIPYLDELEQKSTFYNSVNTVKNSDGRLIGYTTDGIGFCRALDAGGADLTGRTVILGAGGVGRVMAFEAALKGGRVTLAVREHSLPSAKKLCDDIKSKIKNSKVDFCLINEINGKIDLLANATPVGMYPNSNVCPVSEETIKRASFVFDAVYNPNDTLLIKIARKNSIPAISGMSMLVWQAAAAQEIWFGSKFKSEDINNIYENAVIQMKIKFGNIVLCGCMGSGKTTIGKTLSQKVNKHFIDMDSYIEEKVGMTVSEIFSKYGEKYFRNMEYETAKEFGGKSGFIIATGGGTLMNPKNVNALKENGVIVMLDVSPALISARLKDDNSRPLLAKPNKDEIIKKIYDERIETFKNAADIIINAESNSESVSKKIIQTLENPLN